MGIVKRFAFIQDEDLRKEIEINYLFISYIKSIYDALPRSQDELDESIEFGYKKTLLIIVSSIIEALLLYTIKTLEIKHEKCYGVRKVTHGKPLGILDTGERLVLYKETNVKFMDDTKFSDLINILCDKCGADFDKDIQDKLIRMKIFRNGVHIHSKLSFNKDFVIGSLFEDAAVITDLCKKLLLS